MIESSIATYLEDKSIGTVGTDIFVGQFNIEDTSGASVQSGVYLMSAPGGGQDEYMPVEYHDIDFWAVNPLSETGYNKLDDIRKLLSRGQNYVAGNYLVYFSHDTSGIMDMGRTQDGLKMYKLSIRFIYRDTTIVS